MAEQQGRRRKVQGTASELERKEEVQTQGPVGRPGAQEGRESVKRPGMGSRPQTGSTPVRPTGTFQRPQTGNGAGQAQRPQTGNVTGQAQRPAGGYSQQRPQGIPLGGQAQRPQTGTTAGQAHRPQTGSTTSARPAQGQQSSSAGSTPSFIPPVTGSGSGSSSGRAGGRGGCLPLIIVALVVLLGGGGMVSGLFGGGSDTSQSISLPTSVPYTSCVQSQSSTSSWSDTTASSADPLSMLSGFLSGSSSGSPLESILGNSWFASSSQAALSSSSGSGVRTDSTKLNTMVASGSRKKYTTIKGNGKDKITLMVYMCGTDLESRSAMATRDIQEMLKASFDDSISLILYTGGCTRWQNSSISSSTNQVWQVRNGQFQNLVRDDGAKAMTDPATLSAFIRYGKEHYPANRYMLILWDHGSGAVAGYGYDEKFTRSGSMSLAGIRRALEDGGVKFDMIGFDACLMASVENALMLSDYADYMIASEETEPGVGWYYTEWLTALGQNPSMGTLELGKKIADDFVSACQSQARGQDTTLSVVDLAELSTTVPEKLTAFSKAVTGLVKNAEYKQVSDARVNCREFAASSKVDQVDLVDFALKLQSTEGKALAEAARAAVKYNRSGSMTNAYGLSVFFPYRKMSNVDKAVSTFQQIGMDDSYNEALRAFASVQVSGQAATGGYQSIPSIFSSASSYGTSSSSSGSEDMISSLLSAFLGGDMSSMGDIGSLDFFSGRTLTDAETVSYVQDHHVTSSDFIFQKMTDGRYALELPAEKWALVHSIEQNVFYDDGSGYLDLGLDNVYEFEDGRLIAVNDGAWVSFAGKIVGYWCLDTQKDGDAWRTTGYIPALLNDMQCELLVVFDNEHEDGYIVGARFDYDSSVTETVAKNLLPLEAGDKIQFICDYYTYDLQYQKSYAIGDPIIYSEDMSMGALYLPDPAKVVTSYRFTDLYNQVYWSNVIPVA